MDSKQIKELIERYWAGETSQADEDILRHFFEDPANAKIDPPTADWFNHLNNLKNQHVDETFAQTVASKISNKKVISVNFRQVARIAAGLLVIVAAWVLIRQDLRNNVSSAEQDTYSDPQLAYEETKKALLLISQKFGEAKTQARKVKIFSETQDRIKGSVEEISNSKTIN